MTPQEKGAQTRKDNKTRKWCLDPINLRPMFNRNYKELEEMWKRMGQEPNEQQKRRAACKMLSLGLWGNFYDPGRANLTPKEIYNVLFKNKNS